MGDFVQVHPKLRVIAVCGNKLRGALCGAPIRVLEVVVTTRALF